MFTKYIFRGALSNDTRENAQGLSEYLGILVALAVIVAIVMAIILVRMSAKAENAAW